MTDWPNEKLSEVAPGASSNSDTANDHQVGADIKQLRSKEQAKPLPELTVGDHPVNVASVAKIELWVQGQLAETYPAPLLPAETKLINAVKDVAVLIPDRTNSENITADTVGLLGKKIAEANRSVYLNDNHQQPDQGESKFVNKFNQAIESTHLHLQFIKNDDDGNSHYVLKDSKEKSAANTVAIEIVAHKKDQLPHDPDALQKKVDMCVKGELEKSDPKPCVEVDVHNGVEHGTVLFKDAKGNAHYLVLPTKHVTGIESTTLLKPEAPNYFDQAWKARGYIAKALNKEELPRQDVAVAVNSLSARTQNLLHLHINCLTPSVRDALSTHSSEIGKHWKPLSVLLAGHQYLAIRVDGEELGQVNPLKLVANGIPGANKHMEQYTVAVAGANFGKNQPGFIILANKSDIKKNDYASGVQLQDDTCKVADDENIAAENKQK